MTEAEEELIWARLESVLGAVGDCFHEQTVELARQLSTPDFDPPECVAIIRAGLGQTFLDHKRVGNPGAPPVKLVAEECRTEARRRWAVRHAIQSLSNATPCIAIVFTDDVFVSLQLPPPQVQSLDHVLHQVCHDLARVIVRYRRLAVSLAKASWSLSRHSHDLHFCKDLEGVAYEALCRAVTRYRRAEGTRFSSYASEAVLNAVRSFIDRIDYGTEHAARLMRCYRTARRSMAQRNGVEPSEDEVLDELGWQGDKRARFKRLLHAGASVPIGPDTIPTLGLSDSGPSPLDALALAEDLERLQASLAALEPRERAVIVKRYCEGRTWQDIGRSLGMKEHQARRLAEKVLTKLRSFLSQGTPRSAPRGGLKGVG